MAEDGTRRAAALVERYLHAVAAQDWPTVSGCLAPTVVRRGPFGDDVEGRGAYLELLRRTMPALPGYRMDLDRVTEGLAAVEPTGATQTGVTLVFAELRETVLVDGSPLETEECLVFEVGNAVEVVSVYIRRTS